MTYFRWGVMDEPSAEIGSVAVFTNYTMESVISPYGDAFDVVRTDVDLPIDGGQWVNVQISALQPVNVVRQYIKRTTFEDRLPLVALLGYRRSKDDDDRVMSTLVRPWPELLATLPVSAVSLHPIGEELPPDGYEPHPRRGSRDEWRFLGGHRPDDVVQVTRGADGATYRKGVIKPPPTPKYPHWLANPHHVDDCPTCGSSHTRDEAIELFRAYAERRLIDDPRWLDPLLGTGLRLVCDGCSLAVPCHADVLLELIERLEGTR